MNTPHTTVSIDVNVNGEHRTLRDDTTLADLLAQLGHAPESVAAAVNGDFVPRADRAERLLRGGDQVACFKPIVGG
jgi:sulfur carrier protein